jgi:hypothetical protein
MSVDLESLRQRAPYDPTLADPTTVEAALQIVRGRLEVLRPFAAEDEVVQLALDTAAEPTIGAHYLHHLEAASLFCGSELDTATPGKRGLGRMTVATWPRLGGAYRKRLNAEAKARIGPIIEALLLDGFVIGVAVDPLRHGGPHQRRCRTLAETMDLWVLQLAHAYDPDSNLMSALFASAAEADLERLRDLVKELRGPLRRGPFARSQLGIIGGLYVSAGIALYDTSTARWDDEALRQGAAMGFARPH